MPHATENAEHPTDTSSGVRRIILCFDGTGNHFQGNESDTNIVKIYQMLDRHQEGQFHYYQPGIGTYVKGQGSSATRGKFLAKLKSGVITTLDQMVGSSFQQHLLAGYEFVMRYYQPGDHIYIFGFSRGAYTARFLAEMIHDLGLLSKGNEEMVQFAWDTFSSFQQSRGNDPQTEKDEKLKTYMQNFNKTFCRPNVEVHFLGLFDCVNSVGQFEIPLFRTSYKVIANPPARYIRHAVAIHERRLKFKPALFIMDEDGPPVDLKEVWFAGNHSDIGGGYGLERGQNHLLSDTTLNWMIQEALNLEGSESKLQFQTLNVDDVSKAENAFPGKEEPGTDAFSIRRKTNQPHDTLRFGHGEYFIMVLLWWILELLPIFTRLELENGKWIPRRLPPNLGAPRDLPNDAVIDPSVKEMIQAGILDKESIPPRGGDNPNLPNVANISYTWKKLRNALSKQASDTSEDSATNDTKGILRKAMQIPAQKSR
ncbi:hypothetical protein N7520_005849 [Penicillium odoratum]|uniref:uncharacterized protein n=1 Tax=Penicillium odoratum TaxID=1167516 RepID=UPI002549BB7D|nr:uncharacterized protein N7520_005849 [Penicillium odoratum]KAJ5758693.1 hypothetical protein N7520_005849 [Penicillium odoratum]